MAAVIKLGAHILGLRIN